MTGTRTALYYPYIAIENRRWIRQAVLYWDEVGSIVPEQVWHEHPYFENEEAEINQLREAGFYRPFFPDELRRKGGSRLQNEFNKEFFERLDYFNQYYNFQDTGELCRMYESKEMQAHLFDELEKRRLATRKPPSEICGSESHHPSIWVEKNTSDIYMSLLAEYLARNDHNSITTPYTDQPKSMDYAFSNLGPSVRQNSVQILFDRVLPVPAENVSLDRIIEFKERYPRELQKFRNLIDSFQTEMQSVSDSESLREFSIRRKEDIEQEVRELKDDLHDHDIETRWGTLGALFRVPAWFGTVLNAGFNSTGNGNYLLCAFGVFAASASICVGEYRAKQRSRRNRMLQDSPYSYIYYAESLQ